MLLFILIYIVGMLWAAWMTQNDRHGLEKALAIIIWPALLYVVLEDTIYDLIDKWKNRNNK